MKPDHHIYDASAPKGAFRSDAWSSTGALLQVPAEEAGRSAPGHRRGEMGGAVTTRPRSVAWRDAVPHAALLPHAPGGVRQGWPTGSLSYTNRYTDSPCNTRPQTATGSRRRTAIPLNKPHTSRGLTSRPLFQGGYTGSNPVGGISAQSQSHRGIQTTASPRGAGDRDPRCTTIAPFRPEIASHHPVGCDAPELSERLKGFPALLR